MNDTFTNCTVVILDRETGLTAELESCSAWWWGEGNGHCDCNRGLLAFPETADGACGEKRYVIVACSNPEWTLEELNDGWNDE